MVNLSAGRHFILALGFQRIRDKMDLAVVVVVDVVVEVDPVPVGDVVVVVVCLFKNGLNTFFLKNYFTSVKAETNLGLFPHYYLRFRNLYMGFLVAFVTPSTDFSVVEVERLELGFFKLSE